MHLDKDMTLPKLEVVLFEKLNFYKKWTLFDLGINVLLG